MVGNNAPFNLKRKRHNTMCTYWATRTYKQKDGPTRAHKANDGWLLVTTSSTVSVVWSWLSGRPVFTPSSQSNYMPWNVMIWCEQKINQVYTKPSSSLWPMSQRDHKLANHSYCINHLYKKMYGVWSAHWWHSKRQQAAGSTPAMHHGTAPSKHDHEKEGCLSHGGSMLGDKRLTEYVLFNGASTKKGRRHIANRGGNELLPHYSLNPMQTGRQEMHST